MRIRQILALMPEHSTHASASCNVAHRDEHEQHGLFGVHEAHGVVARHNVRDAAHQVARGHALLEVRAVRLGAHRELPRGAGAA
jgi:hypothetical protein